MQAFRRIEARRIRQEAAEIAFLRPHPDHVNNGEEGTYAGGPTNQLSYIANFSKCLPHNTLGEVDPAAYRALLRALNSGNPADFEAIPLGPGGRKLVNPQAGFAFDLEGADARSLAIPPAPRIDSAECAAEMGELYWQAICRDIRFADYDTDTTIQDAADSLSNQFSDFRGPKQSGQVTPSTLFRGLTPGDVVGPYLSQFLLKDIRYGSLTISQKQRTVVPAPTSDYLQDYNGWLAVQNGEDRRGQDQRDSTRRYIRNGRDLGEYVHVDELYEAYLNALFILMDMRARWDPGNPYLNNSHTQEGFATFGGPHINTLVCEVATRALKAVWFQKWSVHRRLRPEVYAGRVHNHLKGHAGYPLHAEILQNGAGSVADRVHQYNVAAGHDTYLLPMAFPEGSPAHPAYGAGHATVAGACVTMLKAWFDESDVFDSSTTLRTPVVANADGSSLVNYTGGGTLTVGGELNKLAANIAIGRNFAGVHWRTDYTASIKLGEAIAISILEEQKTAFNEYHSFTLTKFDGTTVTI